jgi:hypothetical protein
VISASFTEAKERWLLRRSKIEEIYLSGATWLTSADVCFLPYLDVCSGGLTYNQALDLQIKNTDKAIGDQFLKMKMNIEMFERSLIPALRLVEQEREKIGGIHSAIRDCYAETGQASEFSATLNNQLLAFVKAGDALKDAVARRGAEIGAEKGQVARAFESVTLRLSEFRRRLGFAAPQALRSGGQCENKS